MSLHVFFSLPFLLFINKYMALTHLDSHKSGGFYVMIIEYGKKNELFKRKA